MDFSNAYNTVNRSVIMDISAKIFPEALPLVQVVYDTPPQTFAAGQDWTLLRLISVKAGVQHGDPLDPGLSASGLQLVLMTAHRKLSSSEQSVAIRANLQQQP